MVKPATEKIPSQELTLLDLCEEKSEAEEKAESMNEQSQLDLCEEKSEEDQAE